MAQQETYPSPTAAQTGSGVSPYQQNHADPDEHLDLNAQLQAAQNHDVHNSLAGQAYNTAINAQQMSQPNQTYGYPAPVSVPFQGHQIQDITGPPQTPEESARKKSKVTRACDECRRKKIKCDAESDAPGAPKCSNCQRTNADCKFSRAPQKRGPSKGYIKELSDRVAQLEGTRSTTFEDGSGLLSSLSGDRKRTWSMTNDGFDQNSPFSQRQDLPTTFGPAPIPATPHLHASTNRAKSLGIKLATPDESDTFSMRPLHPAEERNMQDFTGKVNRVLPLLGSRDGINQNLGYCKQPLRIAFYYAVAAVVGTIEETSSEQSRDQCAENVFREIRPGGQLPGLRAQWDERPYQANLVYLQTLLLCVMYHQTSGPSHEDFAVTCTCTQLLELAQRLIDHMQIRQVTEPGHLGISPDAGRVFASVRRAFWVFVVLDAWHSIGTRAPRFLPYLDVHAEMTPADRTVLNDNNFIEFVRISAFAGSFSDLLRTNSDSRYVMEAGLNACQALHVAFGDVLTQLPPSSETPQGIQSPSFATLAYATVDLLCLILQMGSSVTAATPQILEAACRVANMLVTIDIPSDGTPLTHHFVIPAVQALTRAAASSPSQRPTALEGLRDILVAIRSKGVLDNSLWKNNVAQHIEEKLNEDGMRGLAHAAAGELGSENGVNLSSGVPLTVAWSALVTGGYLNCSL